MRMLFLGLAAFLGRLRSHSDQRSQCDQKHSTQDANPFGIDEVYVLDLAEEFISHKKYSRPNPHQ